MYAGMARGSSRAHSSCLLPGNRYRVTSQAGITPKGRARQPTPAASSRELTTYSASTVSYRCCPDIAAGEEDRCRHNDDRQQQYCGCKQGQRYPGGHESGRKRISLHFSPGPYLNYFQPARSIARTAAWFCSPSTARFRLSALNAPQDCRMSAPANPSRTGNSLFVVPYHSCAGMLTRNSSSRMAACPVPRRPRYAGAADVDVGPPAFLVRPEQGDLVCRGYFSIDSRTQHACQVVGIDQCQVALPCRHRLDLVAVAAFRDPWRNCRPGP